VQLFDFLRVWVKGGIFMSVNTYTRGQKQQLTEHFNISEFHCKGAKCGCTETLHDPALSAYLQQIREHFDKPLYITSGFRCEKHNQAVGGVVGSLHAKGMAADIVIQGVKPLEIAQYAEQIGVKGIGLYDQFVHIDTRENKSFWYDHKQEKRETFADKAPIQGVYVVTCRINDMEGVHTLVFDRSAGDQIQPICGYDAAIRMTADTAECESICIGRDHVKIVSVTKLGI
jgi:hypothetical protein